MSDCIACGSPLVRPYYNPGPQPLAALNLPRSREDAATALRYPLDFHVCLRCGHIFNVAFDVAQIPYAEDSNLMYNSGGHWDAHLDSIVKVLGNGPAYGSTVIDIGAGDGLLLAKLQQAYAERNGERPMRCIAFEPGVDSKKIADRGIEVKADYFIPARDVARYKPDMLVCRHVLEHMENPRDFLSELAYHCLKNGCAPHFLAEVPCIEKAVDQGRFSDFLYEHVSHFTKRSFKEMFESCGWFTFHRYTAYNDEVLVWLGAPALEFFQEPVKKIHLTPIRDTIRFILSTYDNVAFWGGTGKSAAFLNALGIPSSCRVVDSDPRKAGRYVPGTAQLIEHSSSLKSSPVDAVIVTTRWRAADIYQEIKRDYPAIDAIFVVEDTQVRQYMEADYVKETS